MRAKVQTPVAGLFFTCLRVANMDIFNTACIACEVIYKTLESAVAFPAESRSLAARFKYDARILRHFCDYYDSNLNGQANLSAEDKALLEESTSYLATLLSRVEICKTKLTAQSRWSKEMSRLTWILRRNEFNELEAELYEWTRRLDLRLVALPERARTVMCLGAGDDDETKSFTPRFAARVRLERFATAAAAAKRAVWERLVAEEGALERPPESGGSQRFCLGTFEGNTVLVETRHAPLHAASDELALDTAWAGAGEFAAALNYLDSTISGLLKCSGFFYSPAPTPSFGHMYILPGEKQGSRSVTSFKDLLHERDARGKRKRLLFSLNQRLEFAKRLATAVLFVHAIGWVHKSIMSQNVLILGRNGRDPRMPGEEKKSQSTKWSLNSPYLVGFEIARSNEAETIPGASVRLPLAISVYKHPELQDDTHVRFDMAHDVYSLGVVLLELGIWSPLEERPELQGISEPRDIAKALFRVANEVEILMGKRYREIVQTCLSQEAEARTGSIKLISEVLEKLEDLAQGV